MTDEALLALVVGNNDAIAVLSAWGGLALPLMSQHDPVTTQRIGALLGLHQSRVEAALDVLSVARVIVDGGITELADRLLQQIVKQRLQPRGRANAGRRQ